ncbi:PD40 domain-containing protein [bacterium]|nr:PD40 domain-containing protein [bacterium]
MMNSKSKIQNPKFIISALFLASVFIVDAISQEAAFPRHPSVSPQGDYIAFSYGGDIWTVPSGGGRAFRLTVSEAYEHSPKVAPDGKWIAFSANRDGNDDIYIIPSAGGQSRQLTYHESYDQVCGWFPDCNEVIFSSRRDDRYSDKPMIYRVSVDGGTPRPVMNAYGTDATVSNDGRNMLYTRSGKNTSWWRRHYLGSASPQIWIYDLETGIHTAVTDTARLETGDDYRRPPSRWPFWGEAGSIYLTTELNGTSEIYKQSDDGKWKRITPALGDGIRFPSISFDGRVIAYEQGHDIYVIEDEGEPRRLEIIAPLDNPQAVEARIKYSDKAERLAFTPDGKQMFLEVRGEVFAGRIVTDDDKAARGRANSISGNNPARDGDFTVSPGGDSLIFVSDRNGNQDLFLAYSSDPEIVELARSFSIELEQLTDDPAEDHSPRWSPDGEKVAFIRGKGDLIILDLESKEERTLIEGWSMLQHTWSPDGKWIAFAREDDNYNSDVFIISLESGEEINVSRHPDEDTLPVWSADGRKLAFRSRRQQNNWNLHFLFLRLEDHYRAMADWAEDERKPDSGKKKKDDTEKEVEVVEVKIDTTEIYRRIRMVAPLADEDAEFDISPDGKQFAYVNELNGERDLFSVKWTGEDAKRLTKGGKDPLSVSFSDDDKRIRFLTGSGKVRSISSAGKDEKSHPFDARVLVNWRAERQQKFGEIWRTLNDRFYDHDFHGYSWTELHDKYLALIDKASCERDFGDLVNMMFGEINSSHMGYRSPDFEKSLSTGRLGIDFDFSADGPGLLISHVQPKGPCGRIEEPVLSGERLIALNGVRLESGINLHRLLQDQVGQRVELIITDGKGKRERRVVVRPMGSWLQGEFRYDEWVSGRRSIVDSLSSGRLGYLHLRGMGDRSLARFEAQLYSLANGRDGLVIDVRYNGGGWTTDYVLAMIQVKRHAVTFPRDGGPGYPQGRLPLFSWVKPVIVLCNEYSFSNAEIFSHSIKTLERGKLVGVPTPGGVISTGGRKLLDGSGFRIPLRGWYFGSEPVRDPDRDMEGNGAVPDIIVPLRPGRMAVPKGRDDGQLRTAVMELIEELKTEDDN